MAVVDFELSLPMISLPTKETIDASFVGLKPVSCQIIMFTVWYNLYSLSVGVTGRTRILLILK